MAELGAADRRNGCYRQHLLTELREIKLAVPRTRPFSALRAVRASARRAQDVDRRRSTAGPGRARAPTLTICSPAYATVEQRRTVRATTAIERRLREQGFAAEKCRLAWPSARSAWPGGHRPARPRQPDHQQAPPGLTRAPSGTRRTACGAALAGVIAAANRSVSTHAPEPSLSRIDIRITGSEPDVRGDRLIPARLHQIGRPFARPERGKSGQRCRYPFCVPNIFQRSKAKGAILRGNRRPRLPAHSAPGRQPR
jgi:hypothetical protein